MAKAAALAVATNYVGGEWRPSSSGQTYDKRNPWRPAETTGIFACSNADDARAAAGAAAEAAPAWEALPAPARATILTCAAAELESRAEQMAHDMVVEMGKPLREARGETARAAAILRFFAGEALRPIGELYEPSVPWQRLFTLRRPIGPVALITPWNFPAAIPAWKTAPALVYGNTVVLKASYEAPRTALHLAEAFAAAGVPPGVLNVLTGPGAEAGAALVDDSRLRGISFTGSTAVGAQVRDAAVARGARVQLELGGQNPLIVCADAELDRAVEAAFAGAFWSAGQKCTATRRIFVQDAVYNDFRARFLTRTAEGQVGDPLDPATEVGPLVNEPQLEDVLAAIERGVKEGATLLAGGVRLRDDAYLMAPTAFEDVDDASMLSCDEVFGPVVSIYRFGELDEALARANAVAFGLSAAIFTRDLRAAHRFAAELEAGILHVNSQTAGADVHVPFGGIKGSAYGPHEQGRAALDFYTETITVYEDAPLP